jgi:hypothetical protein
VAGVSLLWFLMHVADGSATVAHLDFDHNFIGSTKAVSQAGLMLRSCLRGGPLCALSVALLPWQAAWPAALIQVVELVFNGPTMLETAKDLLSVGFAVTMGLAEAQGKHLPRGDGP